MFIDFVDVEMFSKQSSVPNNFHINIIYKHLILGNHFGTERSWGVGQSFRNGGSIKNHVQNITG